MRPATYWSSGTTRTSRSSRYLVRAARGGGSTTRRSSARPDAIERSPSACGMRRPSGRRLPGWSCEGMFTRLRLPALPPRPLRPRDSTSSCSTPSMSACREAAATVRFDEHMGGYALVEHQEFRIASRGSDESATSRVGSSATESSASGSADERRFDGSSSSTARTSSARTFAAHPWPGRSSRGRSRSWSGTG